jgi:hypothetical protein
MSGMRCKGGAGKSPQLLRVRSANFSKPTIDSSTMHTVAVNAPTTGSGAKDSKRCDVCVQREWHLSVLVTKTVNSFVRRSKNFLLKDFRTKGKHMSYKIPVLKPLFG